MELIETILIVIVAIAVILFVVWLAGGFKGKLDDSFQPEVPQEELELKEVDLEKVCEYKVFHAPKSIPEGKSGNKKVTTYTVLDKYYKHKSGDYYQVIESSNERRFYLNSMNTRVYIPADIQLFNLSDIM